jgi:hypothetical protein
MKRRICLLLCILICGLALSPASASEFEPTEVNTKSFTVFQVRGDLTPVLLFFVMLSAERTNLHGGKSFPLSIDDAIKSAHEREAKDRSYVAKPATLAKLGHQKGKSN